MLESFFDSNSEVKKSIIMLQDFFDSSVFYKNFAETIEFPHKVPAQVPHFKTRPGYKLAKTWPPAVPVLQHHH